MHAGVFHDLTDFLPVVRFVAVGRAILAFRFGIVRASFQTIRSVGEQIVAFRAENALGRAVVAGAVHLDEFPEYLSVLIAIHDALSYGIVVYKKRHTLPRHYYLSVAGGTDITLDAYLVDTHGEIGHGQVACFDHGSGQTAAAGNLHPEHSNTLRRGNT